MIKNFSGWLSFQVLLLMLIIIIIIIYFFSHALQHWHLVPIRYDQQKGKVQFII